MMDILEVQGQERAQGQEAHRGHPSLLEVLDRALDKGLVVERWRSVRILGIDLLTLDFDSVVASFAKYLDYAEAMDETIEAMDETIEAMDETASRFDKDDGEPEDGEPEQLPRYPSASA